MIAVRRLCVLLALGAITLATSCSEVGGRPPLREEWYDDSVPADVGTVSQLDTSGISTAVSDGGAIFVKGNRASAFSEVFRGATPLRAISRMIAVGDGGFIVRKRDDRTWTTETPVTDRNLNAVWNDGESLAVGDEGTIVHDTEMGWAVETIASTRLSSVWKDEQSQYWIVGGRTLWRGRPEAWQEVDTGYDVELRAIAGYGADLWAVGEGGAILGWNGFAWQRRSPPTTENLRSVAIGHPPGLYDSYEVWAIGEQGTVLRWLRDGQPEGVTRPELVGRVVGVAAELFHPTTETVWFFGRDGLICARFRSLVIAN